MGHPVVKEDSKEISAMFSFSVYMCVHAKQIQSFHTQQYLLSTYIVSEALYHLNDTVFFVIILPMDIS